MLRRFCDIQVTEAVDEPLENVKSAKQEEAARRREGERALAKCEGYIIACDMRGKKYTSEAFASKLDDLMLNGGSAVTFVVGGSLGLPDEVRQKADMLLSFSDMTMPHRLFRIVLLEQVYRAFKIIRGETYHK